MFESLELTEAQNILKFLNSVIVNPNPNNFRKEVNLALLEIFGYSQSIFWISNNKESIDLNDPVYLNINENILDLYLSQFKKMDFLHPYNLSFDIIKSEVVLNMDNLVSNDQLLNSAYYLEFLKRNNDRREMVAYLIDEDRLIGALSVIRKENEKEFTTLDLQRFKIISKHLTRILASNLLLANYDYRKNLPETSSGESMIALIIFDANLKVHYNNQAANELCKEFLPNAEVCSTPQQFINTLLHGKLSTWRSGIKLTVVSPRFKYFTIHIVPDTESNRGFSESKYFNLYLYANINEISSLNTIENGVEKIHHLMLTAREYEVVKLVIQGLNNQEIANKLFISLPTVKAHLQNIFKKLDVQNRTSLCYKLGNVHFP